MAHPVHMPRKPVTSADLAALVFLYGPLGPTDRDEPPRRPTLAEVEARHPSL